MKAYFDFNAGCSADTCFEAAQHLKALQRSPVGNSENCGAINQKVTPRNRFPVNNMFGRKWMTVIKVDCSMSSEERVS